MKSGAMLSIPSRWCADIVQWWRSSSWERRVFALLTLAYVLGLASMFYSNHHSTPRSLYLFLTLPLAAWVIWLRRREMPPGALLKSVVLGGVVAYLVLTNVASFVNGGADSHVLLRETRLVVLIVAFLLLTGLIVHEGPRMVTIAVCALAVLLSLSALCQMILYVAAKPIPSDLSVYRLVATFGFPDYRNSTNISAPYALFFVAIVAAVVGGQLSRRMSWLLAPAAAVLLAAVLFTQSRNALLALVLGTAVATFLAAPVVRRVTLGLVAASGVAVFAIPAVGDAVVARGSSYRPEIWSQYLAMAANKPLLGYGSFQDVKVAIAPNLVLDQAHNIVLSSQIRAGLGGAAAILLVLLAGLYFTTQYWRRTGNAIPLCMIATMGAYSMLDYTLSVTYPAWPWVAFWLPMGLAAGAESVARRQRARSGPGTSAG